MIKAFALSTLFVCSFATPLAAKAASCDGSTLEMLECIQKKIDSQEGGISAKTAKIIATLESMKTDGDGTPADYDEAQKNLLAANAKYDEAANLQCRMEGALATVTGSLGRLVAADCLLQQKSARNAQLRRLVKSQR